MTDYTSDGGFFDANAADIESAIVLNPMFVAIETDQFVFQCFSSGIASLAAA